MNPGRSDPNRIVRFFYAYSSSRTSCPSVLIKLSQEILGDVEFEKEWNTLWIVGNCLDDFPWVFATPPEIFEKVKKDFIQGLFEDTLGFTAAEIIRRIVGIAHIADFESISDLDVRAKRESMASNLAIDIVT